MFIGAGELRAMRRLVALGLLTLMASAASFGQRAAGRDPEEPQGSKPAPKLVARMAPAVPRREVNDQAMRSLIHELVACGTRLTLSSWTDPQRGIGCARDHIVARFTQTAKDSGGKLQIVVDKFESKS